MERDGLQRFISQTSHRILTREEEHRLAVRKQAGDRAAFDSLVMHNVRLVYSLARRQTNSGVPLDDLIQYGLLGLIRAVQKFEPGRGFKLSTYATWWIRQAIDRGIVNQEQTIRVPTHVNARVRKMVATARSLEARLGRGPTDDELCAALKIDPAKLAALREANRTVLSLDWETFGGDGNPFDTAHARWLVSDTDVAGDAENADVVVDLYAALERLGARERQVVEWRYGLNGSREHSFQEIGDLLGLTRARAQQIEARALAKMRTVMRIAAA